MTDPKSFDWTPQQPGDGFYCESQYGVFERKPIVQITVRLRDEVRITQVTPDNARALAMNLLECAEAADMDAVVIEFLQKRLGQTLEVAATIVGEFRELRDELKRRSGG